MNQKKTNGSEHHDACVRELATELKRDKWLVKANMEGWEKPPRIGSRTPDIVAEKGCLKRICEVITEDMFEGDRERFIEVKNYCDEYDFHLYIVDKDGNRKQIEPRSFGKK